MILHHTRHELGPYFRLNQAIHEKILDAARNPTLAGIYRGLAGRIRRARYQANMSGPRWTQAVAEHEEMLAALTARDRSEEHTSELQSLMRISYAVFCLKKKKHTNHTNEHTRIK